jgi:hypothetical protein
VLLGGPAGSRAAGVGGCLQGAVCVACGCWLGGVGQAGVWGDAACHGPGGGASLWTHEVPAREFGYWSASHECMRDSIGDSPGE